jgi:hypothetical protein
LENAERNSMKKFLIAAVLLAGVPNANADSINAASMVAKCRTDAEKMAPIITKDQMLRELQEFAQGMYVGICVAVNYGYRAGEMSLEQREQRLQLARQGLLDNYAHLATSRYYWPKD